MLYEGLSKRHSLRLLDILHSRSTLEDDYKKSGVSIQNSLYRDAYFGFKFWGLMSETIKRTHTSLGYILRKQYAHADDIYNVLSTFVKTHDKDSLESIKALYRLVGCGDICIWGEYICAMDNSLLFPMMRRFSIFSPLMRWCILLDLICYMMDQYIEKGWSQSYRNFMNVWLVECIDKEYDWDWLCLKSDHHVLSGVEKRMMLDELSVFKSLRQQHGRGRRSDSDKTQ